MIYFAGLLAIMWSLGCFGLPLWAFWTLHQDDYERGMAWFVLLIGWPLACLIGTLPWAFFASQQSPVLAILKKNEWTCFSQHTVVTTTSVMSGKVMVPVVQSHQVCDQYNRR